MAGIIDYINQIRNKFQFLKWIQIVPQESLATKKSALYFVEKSTTTAEAIIVDDLGQKRKIVGGSGGSSFNGIETDDSATVTFTGDGTVGNPLIAESAGVPANMVTTDTNQAINGVKKFESNVSIQEIIISSSKNNKSTGISPLNFAENTIKDTLIVGYNSFSNINSKYEPTWATANSRYVALGTDIFQDFRGDTDYRPSHNVHDSWVGVGSNLGAGVVDGTNVTLIGTTNFYLNDVSIWDSVTVSGKGNTNAKGVFNDSDRVALSKSNFNLRDMMAEVTIFGNENWFGDIHSSTIIGSNTRLWRYAYNSIVLGIGNMNYNADSNAFLDNDIIIGNNISKNLAKYADSHNLLIGSSDAYDANYIPLIEGNFKEPYLKINGRFEVNNTYTQTNANNNSMLNHASYKVEGALRNKTYISGRNNLNAQVHTHPTTSFGGFVVSGVDNFPLLASDASITDKIDSITVYGQRNGLKHKKAYNLWSFGTTGHTEFSNSLKNVLNFGVLGLGTGLTGYESPTTPTSGKVINNIENVTNFGVNYTRFAYNSSIFGTNNSNWRMITDSTVIGNSNLISLEYVETLDSSIVIGNSMVNDSRFAQLRKNYNLLVGQNGVEFMSGYYGDDFQKFTKLRGKVILDERLKLKSYTKEQRDILPNQELGEIIWQTDTGNSGIRVYDGVKWLALQTLED